jgi:pseudouridine-5'-phosphate glycosidase
MFATIAVYSEQGIVGKESTPFLLKRVNELTGGNSLKSSKFLLYICGGTLSLLHGQGGHDIY